MEASIRSRIAFEPTQSDPLTRYAALRFLLDDSWSREAMGSEADNRDFRRQRRRNFSELLSTFQREAGAARHEWIAQMDASESWELYGRLFRQKWVMRKVVLRLRLALLMHGAHVPGSVAIARNACERLRQCFPPAPIVPIHSQVR